MIRHRAIPILGRWASVYGHRSALALRDLTATPGAESQTLVHANNLAEMVELGRPIADTGQRLVKEKLCRRPALGAGTGHFVNAESRLVLRSGQSPALAASGQPLVMAMELLT